MKKIKTIQTGNKILAIKSIYQLLISLMSISLSQAQNLELVKDVNPSALSQAGVFGGFVPFNSQTIFRADDGTHGGELWVTNGTGIGTNLLKDINTVSFGSNNNSGVDMCQIAVLNNQFYFGANDGNNGTELWVSDGTANGTFMLKDIVTGSSGSDAKAFITFQNKVYFAAKDAFGFLSLWATDGTAIGTVNIKDNIDIQVQPNGTIGSILNGKLYFKAFDVINGSELWTSDGTTVGTTLVKDIFPGTGSGMGNKIAVCNGLLYFYAKDNNTNGNELWKSDGTTAGTLMIKDIGPTPVSSVPYNFTAMNGLTYFAANDGPNFESNLYVTDGTSGGTQKVKQINTTSNGSAIGEIIAYDNKIYFSAFDGVNGSELWVSDGTNNGTQLFADINPGAGFSSPQNLMVFNQKLLFMAAPDGSNNVLFETDHDANNLHIISSNPEPIPVFSPEMALSNGVLYFNGTTSATDDAIYRYPAQEPIIIWTGGVSTNWFNISNWSPNQIPSLNDDIQIPTGMPRYPAIGSGTANCRKMEIQMGASLTITGGILNVYGEITASNQSQFHLFQLSPLGVITGGTMNLMHGSNFPPDMFFYNLTIKNINDVEADNTYSFQGLNLFYGNLKIESIGDPDLPKVVLGEDVGMSFVKNFSISAGKIGYVDFNNPLTDHTKYPTLYFGGYPNLQNITINNLDLNQGFAEVKCNVAIFNENAKFISSQNIYMYNLFVGANFDLAGKSLNIYGKVVYDEDNNNNFRIRNTKPSAGKIVIYNTEEYVYDNTPQFIKIDRLRTLKVIPPGGMSMPNLDVALVNSLAVDTLQVNGYLDLAGRNLTIGKTTTSIGFLDVDSLGSSVALGKLTLLGNSSTPIYILSAKDLNNITVNSPAGVELNNAYNISPMSDSYAHMKLYGTAKLTNGDFDLKGSSIHLTIDDLISTSNIAKIIETPGNTFTSTANPPSTVPYLYIEKDVTTAITSKNYGGLGFIISCSTPLNYLKILRQPVSETGLNGGTSINRQYAVQNPGGATGLNANVSIEYDESELLGLNEGDLQIFRRSSEDFPGVWQLIPSTVNTTTNTVTASVGLSQLNYGTFTYYTLASITSPMRNVNELNHPSESNSSKVLVYPNPFNESATLTIHENIELYSTVIILYDMYGKTVRKIGNINQHQVKIEKGNLDPGVYLFEIVSASQTISNGKLIIY